MVCHVMCYIRAYGFAQSYADYFLFSFLKGSVSLYVLVYLNDLLIIGSIDIVARFKRYLSSCFHIIKGSLDPTGNFLSQRTYALDILSEIGM